MTSPPKQLLSPSKPVTIQRSDNFYNRFAATAERFGPQIAIELQRREGVESVTYTELRRRAESAAGFLASRGIVVGDRCAILADNTASWCAAYLGILRLGAVAVPFDTHYSAAQIATLLRDCGATIFLTTPRYLQVAREAQNACGTSSELVLLEGAAAEIASLAGLGDAPSPAVPPCSAAASDPAIILYTSGTTSDPKGVVLTHGNLLAEVDAALQVLHVDESDCILGVLPLFHALAQLANLLLPFYVGARVVFLEEMNTAELLRALRERGVTAFCCVPQFFYLLHQRIFSEVAAASGLRRMAFRALLGANGALRRGGLNLGPIVFRRVHDVFGRGMRLLVTGGARFDPEIARDYYRLGLDVLQAYGLTECSGAATVMRPGEAAFGTAGAPLPGIEVKILPPEANREDGAGEIAIRGPIVMQGYFGRPDATSESLRDGWLLTGDLGLFDATGRLSITGRKKEVIILSSGKNIYPEEVEAHYAQSPYIKELCVMGLAEPNEPAAERLHAIIVPDLDVMRDRKVLNMREILRFEIENLSVHLPSHKRILGYDIWTEELPRTTTRKLKRYEIERRAQAAARVSAEESPAAATALSEEDIAWTANPEVARALGRIREAARHKDAVRPGANLELDLGLDSIERVELLADLQQLFSTHVPDEVANRIYTVRELVDAVLEAARRGEAGAGPTGRTSGAGWDRLLTDLPVNDPGLAELLKPHRIFTLLIFGILKFSYLLNSLLLRFRATGLENIPRHGPFLICPNHQSYLDPFLLTGALPFHTARELFFVGASEYFATPGRARAARLLHIAPVDPDPNLLRALQAGAFGLRHGKVLLLFPEGERSIDGEIKKFKKGASILSLHLQAPIVPVALDGAFDVWPRNRSLRWRAFFPWANTRVNLRFGPPLPPPPSLPAGASPMEAESRYAAATERLRQAVLSMQAELRCERKIR